MNALLHARTELEAGAPNAVSRMLGLLGDEWNLLIVQQSLLGANRYGEYLARLPISNAVLTTRLRSLTSEGLLERREYQDNPPRTEYLLTPRGRALWPMMLLIWDWERRWVPDHVDQLPTMRHVTCGALFTPPATEPIRAFLGGDGLGRYVRVGLGQNNDGLLVAGALLIAALAGVTGLAFGAAERLLPGALRARHTARPR